MEAIRIRRKLDSDTVPELKSWIGRTVEIIVLEETSVSLPPGFTAGTGNWAAAQQAVESLEDYDFQAVKDLNEAVEREPIG